MAYYKISIYGKNGKKLKLKVCQKGHIISLLYFLKDCTMHIIGIKGPIIAKIAKIFNEKAKRA